MNAAWVGYLLHANLFVHAGLIASAVWCIACPQRRIYPMREKDGWYYAMWIAFGFVFLSNPAFVILDWNSGVWSGAPRFWLGIPLLVLGVAFLVWGIATLGVKNSSALRDGFITRGPYRISRNPQYIGDFFIFSGVIIVANSELVLVTHLLTSLVFVLAALAEEPWLEVEYADQYAAYRRDVPRFL